MFVPQVDEDVRVRAVLWSAVGYFLLDLVPLIAPTRSALEVGQSIGLLFNMALYFVIRPIDDVYKFGATQVVVAIILASTGLDIVDMAFNVNFSNPLSLVPAAFDVLVSVFFLLVLAVDLHRAPGLIPPGQQLRARPLGVQPATTQNV